MAILKSLHCSFCHTLRNYIYLKGKSFVFQHTNILLSYFIRHSNRRRNWNVSHRRAGTKKCSKFILIANIKAKLSLQLMKHQATEEYERVKLYFTILNLDSTISSVLSCTPPPLYLLGKRFRYSWNRKMLGTKDRSR